VIDTGKLAPYDVLMPDEELAPEEVKQIQLASSMWTASGYYHLLPWSCVVLESVPEAELAAMRSRGRGEAARAAALATAGGPLEPTEQQLLLQRASKRAASSQSLMDEIKASKSSLRDLQH
jgi:isoamylase